MNPVTGNNGNSGQTPSEPFRALGHALTQAGAGDNVFLAGGTYQTSETFPIELRSGVRVSALGGTPVFDGNGATTVFSLAENITQETEISGLTVTDAVACFRISAGRSVEGLVLDNVSCAECVLGFSATLTTGNDQQEITLRECAFLGDAGTAAVFLSLTSGTTLVDGGVKRCVVLGGFDTGISLLATDTSVFGSGFLVESNTISGVLTGIHLRAEGAGISSNVATVGALVRANLVTGASPAVDTGLLLEAELGGGGAGARVSSRVEFNELRGCDLAVGVTTINNGIGLADVISDFFGNVLVGTLVGLRLDVTQPTVGERNADPNFGGNSDGGVACLNTFSGFTTDIALDLDQIQTLFARFCWFDGAPVVLSGIINSNPRYDDPLRASLSGSIRTNVAGEELTLTAGATTGFVDFGGNGSAGQISVRLDSVGIPQSDIEALPIGAGLVITLPALSAGNHTLVVTNPGGQSGTFSFALNAPGEGGASGCFVATAAHGNYDAPEVKTLRGLRDEYLAMSQPGRSFIRWYYREGPAAADWIRERPWARATTRAMLQPAVWTSQALIIWNPGQRLAVALLLLGGSFALIRRRRA